ncbi:sulfatase-like hydrolase/transferase [Bifidobacterium sp. CP2]|nr:sulfatase-like hydrolase/transferase [Bifidobacterium sp. CP2]
MKENTDAGESTDASETDQTSEPIESDETSEPAPALTPDSIETGANSASETTLTSDSIESDESDATGTPSVSAPIETDETDASETDQTSDSIESDEPSEPEPTSTSDSEESDGEPDTADASGGGLRARVAALAAPVTQSKAWRGGARAVAVTAPIVKAIVATWRKRPKCPYTLYALVLALVDAASVMFIQWGMYSEPTYDDPNSVDETTKLLNSVRGQLTRFVAQMWMEQRYVWLLNFAALAMIYLVLVFLFNRFWVATAVFAIITSSFAVANSIKLQLRNEPIIPSDLSFLSSGNGGEISSFIPKDSEALVQGTITMLVWLTVACLVIQFLDGRRCVIPFHWWRPFRNVKTIIGNLTRFVALGASVALLLSFAGNLGSPGAWSYEWAQSMGDSPRLYNAAEDANVNGPTVNFLRLSRPKIMDKPDGYSKDAMEAIAAKYAKQAKAVNKTRANEMTDSTVIMILSETFSDPTRVPGITMLEDPMPNIRGIKNATTSGLMLSPGYGGGTANIEYQTLTGLDLALFDDSMQSMYQELVPHQKSPYSFNQIWNQRYGKTGSTAFHPYYKNMYLRDANYKRFGFNKFYTLDSTPAITHQDLVDNSPFVSDAASYQNVIDQINAETHPQFVQLVTMQNHMPYSGWYNDNQFDWANVSENLSDDERYQINTYAKGVSITDQSTADFLNQLNAMDKPVTVIFYGDHLPGIYQTASQSPDNDLALHQSDWFIWSNQASVSANVKLDPAATSSNVTSPNYFMELASEHMNAKVSPYLAFLAAARMQEPAFERLVLGAGGFSTDTSTTYLDANGGVVKPRKFDAKTKRLMREYRLIQYDMTAGKNYLADTSFFDVK